MHLNANPLLAAMAFPPTAMRPASLMLLQILLYAVSRVDELRKYLENSRWKNNLVTSTMPQPVRAPRIRLLSGNPDDITSAGDALRSMDAMGVYRGDEIVLVDGLVVSNARLRAAVAAHAARRKADADKTATFMTLLLTQAGTPTVSGAPSLSAGARLDAELRVRVDPDTGRISTYDEVRGGAVSAAAASIGSRGDFIDTRIYVIGIGALMHWTENYDYQDIRAHYLHNEAVNVEFPFHFHAHVLAGGAAYASVVTDIRSYAAVNADVVARKAFPVVPTSAWAASSSKSPLDGAAPMWSCPSRGVYIAAGAVVAPNATLREGVLILEGAVIGQGAVVAQSIVGAKCVVAPGASVVRSILHAGVDVGSAAVVRGAIVGSRVRIGAGVSVREGCVLGEGATIAGGVTLPQFTRLTARDGSCDGAVVGKDGIGRAWPRSRQEEIDVRDAVVAAAGDDGDDGDDDGDGASAGGHDDTDGIRASTFPVAAAEALLNVRATLATYGRLAADNDGEDSASEVAVRSARDAVASATRAALRVPFVADAADAATAELRAAVAVARTTAVLAPLHVATVAPSSSASIAAAATPAASLAAASATAATNLRFIAGVRDILLSSSGTLQSASDARSLGMEIKSLRFTENVTSVAVVTAAMPLLLDGIARPEPWNVPGFLSAMKLGLAAWVPLFEAIISSHGEQGIRFLSVDACTVSGYGLHRVVLRSTCHPACLPMQMTTSQS